jgi:hypothetical protein
MIIFVFACCCGDFFLTVYKEKYGHVNVSPSDGEEYVRLSTWLGTQKTMWKKALNREPGGLSLCQIELLANVGVTLHRTAEQQATITNRKRRTQSKTLEKQTISKQKAEEQWQESYKLLLDFKNEHGEKKGGGNERKKTVQPPKSHVYIVLILYKNITQGTSTSPPRKSCTSGF